MSYTAQVFRVMIASPSDVNIERHIIRSVLADWNVIHSLSRATVVLPIGWETHSAPDLGGRPQEIINKQVLKDCDFLVGVFWTRIGTTTGDYVSGSVEEIEEHIASGKPAMLYFSGTPVALDSVDQNQYQELQKFKAECYKRGLVETFSGIEEFKDKFTRQLQLHMNGKIASGQLKAAINQTPLPLTSTRIPKLTAEAQQLLIEASKSVDGTVVVVRGLRGAFILISNGKNFIADNNTPKTRAIWESAVDELFSANLLTALNGGTRCTVTRSGYEIAELLAN